MAKESEPSYSALSNEEELQRAKWFKEDLEKGEGWSEATNGPGYTYWIKTFRDEEVPTKILFAVDMPFPANIFLQLLDPRNHHVRLQWDTAFLDHQVLETLPGSEGCVTYMRTPSSCFLTGRSFVLLIVPPYEVDWYGKGAQLIIQKNASHPSMPEGADGFVRAKNGGNFFVLTPDEDQPESACRVFGLTNNNYNGWLPSRNVEFLLKRAVPSAFNKWREDMIEGYNRFYKSG